MHNVNLGCGSVFIDSPDWLNLDYSPINPLVRKANLLGHLPCTNDSASLVYSSHFLEHVPRAMVANLLQECFRVLQPGGVLRLVVPDLENMAREYLTMRDSGAHEKADFVVTEMIDQCVRSESGGELGRYYGHLRSNLTGNPAQMIEYVRKRTGEDLSTTQNTQLQKNTLITLSASVRRRIAQYWIRLCLLALPKAFRTQNISLSSVGERHHWLWDFHQLKTALEAVGFDDVQRHGANSSRIPDFPFHPLDLDADGQPRKGIESMYVEANKPNHSM